ncbi:MAG: hypothetical protein FWE54_01410 [Methanimicrococcus sp.]|nr:hypothetical protein [Methanimicrococcus sp.]
MSTNIDFNIITDGLKKSWDVFVGNAVPFIVGLVILFIAAFFSFLLIPIVLVAPLGYGFAYMTIRGIRGEKVEIGDIFIALKSVSMFIRSWMYFIIPLAIIFVLSIFVIIFAGLLATISGTLSFLFLMFLFVLCFILGIALIPVLFFALYIYVMTPSENVVYAYKEGFNVFKGNIIMTIITIIVVYLLSIIPILGSILGGLLTVHVLKTLKPDLRDDAHFD